MTGADIYHFLKKGVKGVQMATRFAASTECNAADSFKEYYVKAKAEDSVLIQSPVGLPGRAILSPLSKRIMAGETIPVEDCSGCLKNCNSNFCIRGALDAAQIGNTEEGLIFAGNRVGEIKEILPVSEIFKKLVSEYEAEEQRHQ